MQIRNFSKFQHFKDRSPPWIKLYRELLDNMDWHALSGDDAKLLTGLWLLASEDETKNGLLPCTKTIAFRLRISEREVKQSLTRLNNWLIQDDISVISEQYQDDLPERETETEIELVHFDDFWNAYPRKEAKAYARKAFAKLTAEQKIAALDCLPTFPFPDDKKYQPLPASWINASRWEDETVSDESDYLNSISRT
jgi:hypothetical protein